LWRWYINIIITILDIIHRKSDLYVLFKTRRFGNFILSPPSGGTHSYRPNRKSYIYIYIYIISVAYPHACTHTHTHTHTHTYIYIYIYTHTQTDTTGIFISLHKFVLYSVILSWCSQMHTLQKANIISLLPSCPSGSQVSPGTVLATFA
jgi:hypothetical protein